jgi:hypothetical protein
MQPGKLINQIKAQTSILASPNGLIMLDTLAAPNGIENFPFLMDTVRGN